MLDCVDPREWFGEIDIYLFDQVLKGRFAPGDRILDAGCGDGRNLPYFLRGGFDVCAVDTCRESVDAVVRLARSLAPHLPDTNFRVERVDVLSFTMASFDAVISSAVLHFACDDDHFQRMVGEMWRVLRPGGVFFARLASTAGIEQFVRRIEGRRFWQPDGSERYLVDDDLIVRTTERLGGDFLEPIRTVNVQHERSMTTWVLRKRT
jgi:SAM-dependent methyltransferase